MCLTDYLTFATAALVFISELLPFIKSKDYNGILHALVLIYNSDCIKDQSQELSEIGADPKEPDDGTEDGVAVI